MAFEFTDDHKKEIKNLVERGFPEGLAEIAICAKASGHDKAIDNAALVVKDVLQIKKPNVKLADQRKALIKQLSDLEAGGSRDPKVIQLRISLKRQLAGMPPAPS